ncbi:TonB-dependent siderophore receptor [Marinobacter shengliensis]|jgi:outer membrane receptor for ferric coprogen and ferric-rhodotorulic acid|uniref:TonB-dependent siderophore receptor n=1 Tax=Marinobacter shengliensis TaxID=1389223 RepID=UPI00257283F0|nr:TonB-dependent receptor [Marinobacter shengliensis]BEH15548.1 second ferric pyoverdine receptor FpvB [Marinobacter shengliensis]
MPTPVSTHSRPTGHRTEPCTLLSLAIAATLGAAVPAPALAQTGDGAQPAAQAGQQRLFNIQSGPLDAVLNRFALEAGIDLSVSTELTQGKSSPGLQGQYSTEQALHALLAGSGLRMHFTGENSVAIELARQDGMLTLPAMTVSAEALTGRSEGTGSYTTSNTKTATKLNLSPRETPQIVNVVTHQMIEDFGTTEMEDVLRLAPGVTVGHTDDDRRSYTARGYAMSIQYDGLPSSSGIDGGVVAGPDSALIDRTEVLLGAAGLMNGAGQPGGVINMVFKRPTEDFRGSASISAGSWNALRMVADVSGPLSEEGTVRGRAVAVDQSEESFRDYAKERKKVFYAVVESDLTDSTLLTLSVQNQDIYDNVTDRSGLPTDNDGLDMDWSRSTFLAPAWNQWNKYSTTYKARLQQVLSANWQLTVQGSALTSEADWLFGTLDSFDSTTGDATFSRWGQFNKETSHDLEVFSSGSVTMFGRSHELVLGGNWTERVWNGRRGTGTDYDTNLYDFDPQTSVPRPQLTLDSQINDLVTEQYGGYMAGHFYFTDRISSVMGTRISWYRYEFGDTVREENEVFTPYAGVIYELNDWASAYASYAEIFNPQSARGTDGNTLEPEVGASHELGVKGEFFNGKLNASAVLFRIQKDNEAELLQPYDEDNICGGWCYAAKGKTTTEGVDLGLSGHITDEVQLMVGFTRYKKDDNDESVHIGKLAGSFQPTGTRWRTGISIDASSKAYGQWGMTQEARTLVGAFVSYQLTPSVKMALNGSNLLDEKYYANAIDSGYGRQYWGQPRSWMLTFEGQF